MPPRKKASLKQPGDDGLIAKIDHKDGCPEQRTEAYSTKRPRDAGGATIRVARCIDCGQFTTKEATSGTKQEEEGDD